MDALQIQTNNREEMVDIINAVGRLIAEKEWSDGLLFLFCPHTSGAVTVNEGADPDVTRDIVVNLRKLVPNQGDYRHVEGNSDAHIKSSLFGCDQMLIVEGGSVRLGTWQRIFFCEFDGPRTRRLWVKFLSS